MKAIVIIGAARSGTKMIGKIFSMDKRVTYFGEVNHIWRIGDQSLEHDALPSDDNTAELIRRRFVQECREDTILVEKTAANSLRLPLVTNVFKDVRIIHVIRDGRDVALSASQKWKGENSKFENSTLDYGGSRNSIFTRIKHRTKEMSVTEFFSAFPKGFSTIMNFLGVKNESYWGPIVPGIKDIRKTSSLLETCAYQWKASESSILNFLENNKNIPTYEVKYEKLCNNPSNVIKELFEFCEFDPPHNFSEMVNSVKNGNLEKWKSELTSDEIDKIQNVTAFLLKHHGYELVNSHNKGL